VFFFTTDVQLLNLVSKYVSCCFSFFLEISVSLLTLTFASRPFSAAKTTCRNYWGGRVEGYRRCKSATLRKALLVSRTQSGSLTKHAAVLEFFCIFPTAHAAVHSTPLIRRFQPPPREMTHFVSSNGRDVKHVNSLNPR